MARAEMAELVDAPGSGPGGGNTVEVRVLFSAPATFQYFRANDISALAMLPRWQYSTKPDTRQSRLRAAF
jgi:hypothetical protein